MIKAIIQLGVYMKTVVLVVKDCFRHSFRLYFLSNDIKSFEPKVEESKASDHLPISVIIEI